MVCKAAGKPVHQPDRPIRRSQQQAHGVARHRAAIKRRIHYSRVLRVQIQMFPHYTLSASGTSSAAEQTFVAEELSQIQEPRCTHFREISGLALTVRLYVLLV